MAYANPKDYGYWSTNLSPDIVEIVDKVKKSEFCRTRQEALRRIVAFYRKNNKVDL